MKTQPKYKVGDLVKAFGQPEAYSISEVEYNGEVGEKYTTLCYDDIFEEDVECELTVEEVGEEYTYTLHNPDSMDFDLYIFETYLVKTKESEKMK